MGHKVFWDRNQQIDTMKKRLRHLKILVFTLLGLASTFWCTPTYGEDPVTVLDPIDDLTTGLGTNVVEIGLSGRYEDPVYDLARFDTVLGTIDVKLFQAETPLTVANFFNYVDKGAYTNSFIHRSAVDQSGMPFVIQGGGFVFDDPGAGPPEADDYPPISTDPPVINEPGISNARGTIAMAKQSGNPNSATSQWYFNLSDNLFLDDVNNNGGYTVFGEVINNGMSVVDDIADIQRWDASVIHSAFNNLPLIDYANVGILPDEQDLVMVWAVEQMPELVLAVENDNPDLVNASLEGNMLRLAFSEKQVGEASVTVKATAIDGRFAEDTFVVMVKPWGDCNDDQEVTLGDAIIFLQVQAGMKPGGIRPDYGSCGADVDGDDRAGAPETAYVLDKIAGWR
jgi:cyclophilin family peptidyl-prolyl cis-trans isomerase